MRLVVLLALEGAHLLDVTGPLEAFATASSQAVLTGAEAPYEVIVASPAGGLVRTACGIEVMTSSVAEIAARPIDTLLVAGGGKSTPDAKVLAWLADRRGQVRRIGAISTGVFLLAASGLLDHRRATTHWASSTELSAYEKVKVESDALYVEDSGVWTSAGVSAGIDMALQMIEQDSGLGLALDTARRLLIYLKRSGGEPQVSACLRAQAISDHNLRELVDWILENPQADLDVPALADRARMSARTLFRAFKTHLNSTPREFIERARLETARRFLEQSDERLCHIARKSGFASTEAMRRAFQRQFKQTPGSYREAFDGRSGLALGAVG